MLSRHLGRLFSREREPDVTPFLQPASAPLHRPLDLLMLLQGLIDLVFQLDSCTPLSED